MYGWRGRIGYLSPTYRGHLIHQVYSLLPEGCGLIPGPLGFKQGDVDVFTKCFDKKREVGAELVFMGAQVLHAPGVPPWLIKGPEFETEWCAEVSKDLGVPFVSPMRACADALKARGVHKVLVLSYFKESLNRPLWDYLIADGFDIVEADGFSLNGETEELYSTKLQDLNHVGKQEVYRFARDSYTQYPDVDGALIMGGGWDAWGAINALEVDLGIPVVYAITAGIEACLRELGVHVPH